MANRKVQSQVYEEYLDEYPTITVPMLEVLLDGKGSVNLSLTLETALFLQECCELGNVRELKPSGHRRRKMIREALQSGDWDPRIGSFHSGEDGRISNGQHRIAEIVIYLSDRPDETVPIELKTGMSEEATAYYDDPAASRNAADAMLQVGFGQMRSSASILRYVAQVALDYQILGGINAKSAGAVLKREPRVLDWVTRGYNLADHAGFSKADLTKTASAATILVAKGHKEEDIALYLLALKPGKCVEGLDDKPGNAALTRRSALENQKFKRGGTQTIGAVRVLLHGFGQFQRKSSPIKKYGLLDKIATSLTFSDVITPRDEPPPKSVS